MSLNEVKSAWLQQGRDFVCPEDGFWPSSTDCCSNLYYACLGGVAYEEYCPGDTVYDPALGRCFPLAQTSCTSVCSPGSSSTFTNTQYTSPQSTYCPPLGRCTEGPSSTTTGGGLSCPGSDGYFPYPGDCSKYIICSGGVVVNTGSCTPPLVFNPANQFCDNLANVPSCQSTATASTSSTTSSTSTTPGGGGFDCPPENSGNGFYPIPDYCGPNYYACVAGVSFIESCPVGSYFDPVLLICVKAEDASCNFKCPADGFFALPGQCIGSYYVCIAGVATLTDCPGTAIFDPDLLRCVPDGLASCQTGNSVSRTSTTQSGTFAPFDCPGTGNYPYPGNCNLYYVCAGGSYIIATCPAGLVFNPDLMFCDNPANVPDCSPFNDQ